MTSSWFDPSLVLGFIPTLLAYLPVTLLIFALASVLGLVLGVLLVLPRLYRVPGLATLAVVVVSYTRGTPILVQLMVAYYILPAWLGAMGWKIAEAPAIYFVMAAYGLSMGAYFSEVLRAAINSVDRGQIEAATTIGMNAWQILWRITLPQAVVIALPDSCSILMTGLKSTSLAFTVGVMDIVGRGQALGAQTMRNFEVYVALALIYYVLNLLIEFLFQYLESIFKLRTADSQPASF
jgi:L-cystine transport system permease protein